MRESVKDELDDFAKNLREIDRSSLDSYKKEFFERIDRISELIDQHPEADILKDDFFKLCGKLDASLLHERTRNKPLGYAGDFLLIDWIYTQKTAESGIGKCFDELFHSYEAAQAVRNRKDYFIRICDELTQEKKASIDILDLGCGSCRDVMEAVESLTNGLTYNFHCVDHEPEAIEYAKSIIAGTRAEKYVELECNNIFRFQTDRTFDLIWSAGLFDYLDNRIAALLIRKLWRRLRPGGWFVFGNFSPQNPTRKGMELVGKWYLLHRTANELLEICNQAGIPYHTVEIENESLGINLFCRIKK